MTDACPTILGVEDEPDIRRFVRSSLSAEGYRVVEATAGARGAIDAATHRPDMAIVDLGLPDIDGIEVVRRIRKWSPMPILILSARAQERSKVEALDAGADDYVTKPFAVGELLARVRVALRHASRSRTGSSVLRFETASVDLEQRLANRDGEPVHLTPIEWDLLRTLVTHAGRTMTHRQLFSEVWARSHGDAQQYLRVHVASLRRKLERDPVRPRRIITEPGVGYRFEAAD